MKTKFAAFLFGIFAAVLMAISPVAVADEGNEWHQKHVVSYPLFHASSHGDVAEVKRLLDGGANPNAVNNRGWTALMIAAANGHAEIVKVLLSAKADPKATNKQGQTAYDIAIKLKYRNVADLLPKSPKVSKAICNPIKENCLRHLQKDALPQTPPKTACDPNVYYGRLCRVLCADSFSCVGESKKEPGHPCFCHYRQKGWN